MIYPKSTVAASVGLLFLQLSTSAVPTLASNYQVPVLPFDYDPVSRQGPLRWRLVNTTGNEWERFVGLDHIDLDVAGNECRSTRRPSPVNLVTTVECRDNHEILTSQIQDTDCKMKDVVFYRTPTTLRFDFPDNDSTCVRPTIDLPYQYPYRWFAQHVEVHLRSEHVVDGRRFDGEIQMYHLGYEDQKRELSAVSVLLDASSLEDDVKLQEYINQWEAAAQNETTTCLNQQQELQRRHLRHDSTRGEPVVPATPNAPVYNAGTARSALEDIEHIHSRRQLRRKNNGYAPRNRMFPYNLWPTIYFYGYRGMITVPPCSEIVTWRILDEPLYISKRQYKTLAALLNKPMLHPETCLPDERKITSPTGENYRPLQVINYQEQEVKHCTSQDFILNLYPPGEQ